MNEDRRPMSRREFLRGRPLRQLLGFVIDGVQQHAASLGVITGITTDQPPKPDHTNTPLPVMRLDIDGMQQGQRQPGLDLPADQRKAFINKQHCLAWRNSPCTSCHEHCPEPDVIRLDAGRPVINTQACTGCADCHAVCPAPVNAILLMPKPNRHGHRKSPQ